LWIAGEALDKPVIRRIAFPLLTALIAVIAYGAAAFSTGFDATIRYSGATKNFVSAVVSAIDRGDVAAAHDELRRFDSVSTETYEGGAFLRWLREPVKRLSNDATINADTNIDDQPVQSPVEDGGYQCDRLETSDCLLVSLAHGRGPSHHQRFPTDIRDDLSRIYCGPLRVHR
jgi:hypothetical protein